MKKFTVFFGIFILLLSSLVQAEELTGIVTTQEEFYDLRTKKITHMDEYPLLNKVSAQGGIRKFKDYLFFSGAWLATPTQNYRSASFMYRISEKLLVEIEASVNWYYLEKNLAIISGYAIKDLATGVTKNIIKKSEFTPKTDFMGGGWGPVSYSYTGPYFYYINRDDVLTERNVETLADKAIFDFKESRFKEKVGRIDPGPRSPNGKYVPFRLEENIYYIDLETKKIEPVYERTILDIFNNGVRGNLFWDKDSRYVFYVADFSWFNLQYPISDFYAFNIETKHRIKLNEGFRFRSADFWYSWE